MGSRLPLHATGVGKVLLAAAHDEVVERVLGALTPTTPFTITDPDRLRRELNEVRRRGNARTSEEMTLGAASVAVPVAVELPGRTVVAAALGVVVPPRRRRPAPARPCPRGRRARYRSRARPHTRLLLIGARARAFGR